MTGQGDTLVLCLLCASCKKGKSLLEKFARHCLLPREGLLTKYSILKRKCRHSITSILPGEQWIDSLSQPFVPLCVRYLIASISQGILESQNGRKAAQEKGNIDRVKTNPPMRVLLFKKAGCGDSLWLRKYLYNLDKKDPVRGPAFVAFKHASINCSARPTTAYLYKYLYKY